MNPVNVTVRLLIKSSLSDWKPKVAMSPSLTEVVGIGARLLLSERLWLEIVGFFASITMSFKSERFVAFDVT